MASSPEAATSQDPNKDSPPPPPPPSSMDDLSLPPNSSSPAPADNSLPSPDDTPPPTNASPPPPSQPPPSPPPPKESPSEPTPSTPEKHNSPPPKGSPSPPTLSPTTPSPPGSPPTFALSPPSHYSPPHKSPSSDSSTSDDGGSPPSSDSSSSSVPRITGIVIGGVFLFALLAICLVCSRRKKKRPYYPAYLGTGGDKYYNGNSDWNSPKPMDHIVKLHPPPGVMGTPVGGAGGWGTAPPPGNTSSEFSSGQHHTPIQSPSPNMGIGGFSQNQFTYDELAAATGGFSQANLLGQGGFGYVHKGILQDGREVAVKSLKAGSGQGEREFQAEVEIISRVHHRHLVSLVGYCIADGQRMLVYEFVPNSTLEFHLYGKGQPVMDWASRLRIAVGSAKGLAYLHEDCIELCSSSLYIYEYIICYEYFLICRAISGHPRIIHRDIKAANILLDNKFEAMVADFGLAKLSSDNFTHVSTRVMGTFGYLAPEYASSGKLSEKSDVFSFGVMLLELITGRRPVDLTNRIMEDSLVDWARPLLAQALEDGNYDELMDPRLEGNFIPQEMARMVGCAAASIRHSARRRPRMSQIVRALEGNSSLEDLSEGVKSSGQSAVHKSSGTRSDMYDTRAYNADMMKFRKMVISNPDNASSEYGATSEYGLNPSSSSSDSRELNESGPRKQKS